MDDVSILKFQADSLETDVQAQIKKQFELGLEGVPSDSVAHLNIVSAKSGSWTVDLSVRFSRGHIAIQRNGTDLSILVESVLVELRNNIRLWLTQREVQNFHVNADAESTDQAKPPILQAGSKPLLGMILEDDPAAAVVLEATLRSLGCEVDNFSMPDQALQALQQKGYDLVVLDWNLPYMKGDEFLVQADRTLNEIHHDETPAKMIPVVICSSLPVEEIEVPRVSNFFFYRWHKGLPFSSIVNSMGKVTAAIADQKSMY